MSDTHALCTTAHGDVYVWGKNHYSKGGGEGGGRGMLGVRSGERVVKKPKKVMGLGGEGEWKVKRGVAGVGCSFGLTKGGVVWWGVGQEGRVSGPTFVDFGEDVEVFFFFFFEF